MGRRTSLVVIAQTMRRHITVGLALAFVAATAVSVAAYVRFTNFSGEYSVAAANYAPGDEGFDTRCGNDAFQDAQGAGHETFRGPVVDRQSHCLDLQQIYEDENGQYLRLYGGRYVGTDANGRTLTGEYYGKLRQTQTSPKHFIIEGSFCISGGNALPGIVNSCATGKYAPARGLFNVETGEGTVWLTGRIYHEAP